MNTMSIISANNLSKIYKNEYSTWRDNKDLNAAKRQEYLRRNPDAIDDYDMQRTKILLSAVEMMEKSLKKNSNKIGIAFETATNLGLGYAALGGSALGYLVTKLGFVNKLANKNPKTKNIIINAITVTSGVLGILAAYPAYNFFSNIESKIHRKRKFETMEKELNDPKIFVVLEDEQKRLFKEKLYEIKKDLPESKQKLIKKEIDSFESITREALNYEQEQKEFEKKYKNDKTLYDNELSSKEIKNAKKDKVLLSILIKELNTKAQSYNEKMQRITDNLITASFALGALFTLCYERIAKGFKFKSTSTPAGLGLFLMGTSTFLANWAQRRATHVGRFKAIQELKQNPEQLVYISKKNFDTIEDHEIEIEETQKTSLIKFIKDFFRHNKEYQEWKKTTNYTGADISIAMQGIEISPEQLRDGKRLQKNLFKTLYKVDKNSQSFSGDINVISESIKYPIALILGTLGSVLGMKHLAKLRNANSPKEILNSSLKYVGTIGLFTAPTLLLNSYFAAAQKKGARISDMITMKEMEDYRFFADYSRFKPE